MTKIKTAVLVFPGSNCDRDCAHAWEAVTGEPAELVWHKESSLPDYDFIILPGGFSFGDYLRCGAIARYSPAMNEVARLAKRGTRILGICNGFQVLTEAQLLPGALVRNRDLLFVCKDQSLRVENKQTDFTSEYQKGQVITLPVAHGEGGFTINSGGLKKLQDDDGIVLRYCEPDGTVNSNSAPNGSIDNIAGIISPEGNVMGLMPHPERLAEPILGGTDGRGMFESVFNMVRGVA